MITFSFARFTDLTSKFANAASTLQQALNFVGQILDREIVSATHANVTLDVKIQGSAVLGPSVAASAGANYTGQFQVSPVGTVPTPGGLVNDVAVKVQTGTSALLPGWDGYAMTGNWKGDLSDGSLTIGEALMDRLLEQAGRGFKETDLPIVVLLHEVLHMLGIDGSEDSLTSPPGTVWGSSFDQLVAVDGQAATFMGRTAQAIFGSGVPLRSLDSWTAPHHLHVMNNPGGVVEGEHEYVGPGSDLMNGIGVEGMSISDLDVAVLVDLGYKNVRTLTSVDGHTFVPGRGPQTIIGTAAEIDNTFFAGSRTEFSFIKSGSAIVVANKAVLSEVSQLFNMEQLVFSDGVLDARFIGTDGNDAMRGSAASQTMFGGRGDDTLVGGGGFDIAVFSGNAAEYSSTKSGTQIFITDKLGRDGTDTLDGVQRLWFADKHLAMDLDGNAGDVYRLYQAAFDRKPDLDGLGFWIQALDKGTTLAEIASGFIRASEFQTMYGAAPTSVVALTKFYQNVLHREPEKAGFDFWLDVMVNKNVPLNEVLISFSNSEENQAQVIGSISGGIEYTFYS